MRDNAFCSCISLASGVNRYRNEIREGRRYCNTAMQCNAIAIHFPPKQTPSEYQSANRRNYRWSKSRKQRHTRFFAFPFPFFSFGQSVVSQSRLSGTKRVDKDTATNTLKRHNITPRNLLTRLYLYRLIRLFAQIRWNFIVRHPTGLHSIHSGIGRCRTT